jgi:hypothetical protein
VHLGRRVSGHPLKLHRIRSRIFLGAKEGLWKYLKSCHFIVVGSDGVCGLLPDG